jgi:hypothetical protein
VCCRMARSARTERFVHVVKGRHVVILTIWDADAETKVYWKSADGNAPKTTFIPGKGIQTFQTAGEFRLEDIGEPNRQVKYGYVLLGLRR